jgi:surfeit locus 1 family protein
MTRRTALFLLIAAVFAALFVRLGMWQLDRLEARRASNALVSSRLALPPVDVTEVLADSAQRFRRVTAEGRYDYEQELVLAARTNAGSPGVHLITPLRLVGRDTAVLVNRGWVYSPDGLTVDQARWREGDGAMVAGYLEELAVPAGGRVSSPRGGRTVHRLALDSIAPRFPYPIARYMLVVGTEPEGARDSVPVRIAPPPLDEGPHQSYALQWFAFASIAVIGAVVVAVRDRRR